jgi:predicted DNA binding CopG/RHH family protein
MNVCFPSVHMANELENRQQQDIMNVCFPSVHMANELENRQQQDIMNVCFPFRMQIERHTSTVSPCHQ